MTKLLQQALDALTRLSFLGNGDFPGNSEGNRIAQKAVADIKQALSQQEPCGCREGECGTKEDKTCRMTLEIDGRGGIPEWTPTIGIDCAISSLRDDAIRLRDGGYTPLQIADDLDVIANDLTQCKPVSQQEQPNRWSEAVIDQLVVHHIYQAVHDTDPRKAVNDLLCISNSIALDPQVSSDAQALIDRGRREAQQEQPAQEPFKWYDGAPPFPQNQESFIAQTIYGERVVLSVLPEEYAYDYTTADSTYMKAENIKKWMQFPDCEFLPPEPAPTRPAQGPCGCREGECETKKDKSCRMTLEIAERDGIPEWTQEQPASVDAYVGAREDAAIWKKRALEAEELNRKFIAELNGPTYLGEPVKQDQPAQEPCGYLDEFGNFENMLLAWTRMKEDPGVAWAPVYKRPAPTQPALSDKQILDIFGKVSADGMGHYMLAVGRAIEAHCRGGAGK
jgi:hypothetical protein